MKNSIFKNALINAFLTAAYISLITAFLYYVPRSFPAGMTDTVLVPIIMLSLFVFSAALIGVLVFGRPVMWYLGGQKREAVSLLLSTLGVFFAITGLAMLSLFLINQSV